MDRKDFTEPVVHLNWKGGAADIGSVVGIKVSTILFEKTNILKWSLMYIA